MLVKQYLIPLMLLPSLAMAEPLLKTSHSWDGGEISYPSGTAEVSSVVLKLEEGKAAPFHCHPIPTMGYVLQGSAKIETNTGETTVLSQGDSVVEVMRTVHRGIALDGPVEIVVFYAGAEGLPTTVLPADDPEGKYCTP
ncbi:MAG: cupin domain-containing protein [Halioglobus sp.]